jgi:hypothetical protein
MTIRVLGADDDRFRADASPRFSSSRTAAARDGIRARYLKSAMAASSSERRKTAAAQSGPC